MTLRDFCSKCHTGTVDITLYDENDKLIYKGPLYLVFYQKNDEISDFARWNTNRKPEDILNSSLDSWDMGNYSDIVLYLGE